MAGNWSTICDSTGNSQVHVFAFDPGNSAHILVGTEQAGIFASANGGITEMSLITDIAAPLVASRARHRVALHNCDTYRHIWPLCLAIPQLPDGA